MIYYDEEVELQLIRVVQPLVTKGHKPQDSSQFQETLNAAGKYPNTPMWP